MNLSQNRLLDVGAFAIALMVVVVLASRLPSRANKIDFAHYYASSRLLVEGRNPYTTPLAETYSRFHFVMEEDKDIPRGTNPPPLLWWFAPFALLPPQLAYTGWLIVEIASLTLLLVLLRKLLQPRLSARAWRFVCAATIASAPVYWHFYYSQVQLTLAAATLAAYALYQANHRTSACLLITTIGLVKIFPLVLVPWFVYQRGDDLRSAAKRAGAVVAFAACIVVLTGPALWCDFYQHGLELVSDWAVNRTTNFSLPSLITNFGFAGFGFQPPLDAARLWRLIGAITGATLIVGAYAFVLRAPGNAEWDFCLLTVVALVGGLTTWPHYFVFLIFPMTVLALHVTGRATLKSLLGFTVLLVMLNILGSQEGAWLQQHMYVKIAANYVPTAGLLALGCWLARCRDCR